MSMEALVEKYVQLRDAKAKLVSQTKEKVARIDDAMAKIEGVILTEFNNTGVTAVRTEAGTAFKTTKTMAGVADWDALLDYIRENGMWNMLERRVSKPAVDQYKDEHDDVPPGVNWREEVTIGIRRA